MSRVSDALRGAVRRRASRRCEYCRRPEGIDYFGHHVDHIIAQKHGGTSDLDNLAWACAFCNRAKGTDLASYDRDARTVVLLYNPRTQHWQDHFKMDGLTIIGITPVGKVTIQLLQMNRKDQLEVRQQLMDAKAW